MSEKPETVPGSSDNPLEYAREDDLKAFVSDVFSHAFRGETGVHCRIEGHDYVVNPIKDVKAEIVVNYIPKDTDDALDLERGRLTSAAIIKELSGKVWDIELGRT